jgi:hypothetical protein
METILNYKVCRQTSVVDDGDVIILNKVDGAYNTFIRGGGVDYWKRSFYCRFKAEKDFKDRVEGREMCEKLFNKTLTY